MQQSNELEIIKFDIMGHNYEVRYFPAIYNTNLFIKFTSYIGSSFSKFLGVLNGINLQKLKEGNFEGDFGALGEGINKIFSSIYVNDPEGKIILEVMSHTTRDGVAINKETFNKFYTGNIEEMTHAFIKTLHVHFAPFLPIKQLSGLLTGKDLENIASTVN